MVRLCEGKKRGGEGEGRKFAPNFHKVILATKNYNMYPWY